MARRVFNAINGLELAQVIGTEVTEALLRTSSKFKQHKTYTMLSFTVEVEVRAYPMEPPSFRVQLGEAAPAGTPVPENVVVETFHVIGGDPPGTMPQNTPPDLIRKSAGLPVAEVERVDGYLVDVAKSTVPPTEPAPEAEPEPAPPRRRPGGFDEPVPEPPAAMTETVDATEGTLDMPDGEPRWARSVEVRTPKRPKKG